MVIAFESKNLATGITDDITVTKPAGTVEGDMLIVVHTNDIWDSVLGAPDGTWTEMSEANANSFNSSCWWKVAGGAEPANYTFTSTQSGSSKIIIARFSSSVGSTWSADDDSGNNASSATITTTSVTALNNSMLWVAFTNDGNKTVDTAPTDVTEIDGSNDGSTATWAYYEARSAGAVTKTIIWSASDDINAHAFTFTETGAPVEPPLQINIGDAWKEVGGIQINIGDAWKEVTGIQLNIGDAWKEVF